MPDVNLNSDSDDGGMKFKIIDISVFLAEKLLFSFCISTSQVLPKTNPHGKMKFANKQARIFVVIKFLTFGVLKVKGFINVYVQSR